MADTPLITIGMTCYNAENTIARAVDSALAQDWGNFEIIIVDDASTDGTPQILQSMAAKYPKTRICINAKNGGVAVSRNRIIEEAKGLFIAFFDDDDESAPERLARQYRRITEYEDKFSNGAFVLCHTARTQRYPDGTERYEPTMGTDKNSASPQGKAVARRILTGKPVAGVFGSTATCSQMARTETYRDLGGFDPSFRRGEDTDFNIRAALKGAHFIGVPDPLVTQTMTLTSDKNLDSEHACNLILLEKYRDFISQNSDYPFCCDWIETKYDFLSRRYVMFFFRFLKLLISHPVATLQRVFWALPNIKSNVIFGRFHDDGK